MKTRKVLFFTMLVFSMVVLSLIIGSKPIYAKNGPADDWAVIELCNDNYDRVYDNGDINNSLIEGMTYDKDSYINKFQINLWIIHCTNGRRF